MTFALSAQRRYGDVWQLRVPTRSEAVRRHLPPRHICARCSRPIPPTRRRSPASRRCARSSGPNSVLTSVGARHMRQRKLLLPPFHGEAVQRYVEMIADVAEQEIDRWPVGEPFALAPRMQAVTLEVIMRGVFGSGVGLGRDRRPSAGCARRSGACWPPRRRPLYLLVELRNARHLEPKGVLAAVMAMVDRQMYAVIRERRAGRATATSAATSSRCCSPRATSRASRSPTTSCATSSCRWCSPATRRPPTRWPGRSSACCARRPPTTACASSSAPATAPAAEEYVEATIHEGMRNRPVIPMIARLVMRPWRLRRLRRARAHPGRRSASSRCTTAPTCIPNPHALRPGALPRRQARHLHVDPVRRRDPALPGGDAGDGRAARRAGGDRAPHRPASRPTPRPSGPRHAQRDDDPARGGCLVARRAPLSATEPRSLRSSA